MSQAPSPASRASGKNASTMSAEIRLGIFMVTRSIAAAKATAPGRTVRTASSSTNRDPVKGWGSPAGWRTTPKPSQAGPIGPAVVSLRLLHLVGDGVEGQADLRAKAAGGGDDADGDQGCDEAVLDGRRTRLVLQETHNVLHDSTPTDSLEASAVLRGS